MSFSENISINIRPQVLNSITRELTSLTKSPPEGIRLVVNEEDITDIQAEVEGPVGTPYFGGVFRMRLVLGAEFPASPPKGYFVTKIFHPNVSPSGEICVNVLKRDWRPDLGLVHVLAVIRCLLIEPNPESALNEEAARLLLENYEDFAKHARLMTSIHAQRRAAAPSALAAAPVPPPSSDAAESPVLAALSGSAPVQSPKKEKKASTATAKKSNLRRL
eukprot:gnl/Hemi2/28044_TR9263_c0_g8_i1.p1 gnl/Hemi2/28044_TR9263_c0_g8~~gnl/Hemi2/28044_TR9263_c0_g8_i1.p1  ORF type:complete len:219 (-),score=79.26 gnl/Hemi2/28044_TR9263_c0_g8_i1:267-923(-)